MRATRKGTPNRSVTILDDGYESGIIRTYHATKGYRTYRRSQATIIAANMYAEMVAQQ